MKLTAKLGAGLILGLAFTGGSAPAAACGACVEDKVAATYDHAVVERAKARHQTLVFAGFEGAADAATLARVTKDAAARAPGVDVDSIRTSTEPAALSFALDPRVATPDATVITITRAARKPLRLEIIRVVP